MENLGKTKGHKICPKITLIFDKETCSYSLTAISSGIYSRSLDLSGDIECILNIIKEVEKPSLFFSMAYRGATQHNCESVTCVKLTLQRVMLKYTFQVFLLIACCFGLILFYIDLSNMLKVRDQESYLVQYIENLTALVPP